MEPKVRNMQQKFDDIKSRSLTSMPRSVSSPGPLESRKQTNNFRNNSRCHLITYTPDLQRIRENCLEILENYRRTDHSLDNGEMREGFYSNPVSDIAQIYFQLNEVFLQRLQDIAKHVGDNRDQKLVTYQEWVNILLKLNNLVIATTEQLESNVARRLQNFRRITAQKREKLANELRKSRRDTHTLIEIVQNFGTNDERDIQGLSLETATRSQIFDTEQPNIDRDQGRRGKMKRLSALESRRKRKPYTKIPPSDNEKKRDQVEMLEKWIIALKKNKTLNTQNELQKKEAMIEKLPKDPKCGNAQVSNLNVHTFLLGTLKFLSGKF